MWSMSSKRQEGFTEFFIGSVKIADLCFYEKKNGQWQVYIRTMHTNEPFRVYDNFSEALKELHRRLNEPPKEKADET